MVYDIQKAGFWKRLSAWFLDAILVMILAVGVALLLSSLLDFDGNFETMEAISKQYEAEAGVSFEISEEEYNALPEAERAKIDEAYARFAEDPEAIRAYNNLVNLSFLIVSLSLFFSFLVLDFAVPMLFGNGQTVGKKVFGLAVVRANGVKVDGVCMFIRAILGKYTIETMVPVMLVIMVFWGVLNIVGPVVILLMGLMQVVLLIATRNNSVIHDILSNTVAVDLSSQMIFGSESELIDYKKRIHADMASRKEY